ncbi:glycosyltransferase [Dactylosporangium sp. CA-233914]|uniref:glycosyltransferase n=1 Tax=Dactylosporangium sp. CA-233914 TaxID=3239934 RepID=UPI003D8BB475
MTARVLHVVGNRAAPGGGPAVAVAEFARSTPQYEHHLLGPGDDADFAAAHDAGRGPFGLARALRRTVAAVRPHVVHLHAAWAGLVGRLVLPRPGAPVAYTPHCFAFEGERGARAARRAEQALAGRTGLAVCVSPRETELAGALGLPAVHVPNTTRVRAPRFRATAGRRVVVTVGRVAVQKDPRFLLRVKALAGPGAAWIWVGGGDPALEAELRAGGVEVTGWLPPGRVAARLAAADAYLHTAAWESCPLALLEAGAAGLPIVARSIPALDALGLDPDLDTPERVAAELDLVLHTGQPSRPRLQEAFAARHTPQAQAAALTEAYEWLIAARRAGAMSR